MPTFEYIIRAAIHAMVHQGRAPSCYRAHVPYQGYVNDGTFATFGTRKDFLRQLERAATSELENMGYASEYAEPGYDTPKRGILFANWNVFPRGLDTLLERAGYAIEWSGEWYFCEDCNKALRTGPNSFCWTPAYDEKLANEGTILCKECAPEEEEEEEKEEEKEEEEEEETPECGDHNLI